MITLKEINEFIESAEKECTSKINNYLVSIVREEFNKVRKHNPRLESIIWGNGTYCFLFEPSGQDDNWLLDNELPGSNTIPKYARRLVALVEIVSYKLGDLNEDISV